MHPGLLIGAGFLLGSAGVKAVTSKCAKKVYVKGIVCGMRAKEGVESVIDEAKAQFDDLMAEASYEKDSVKIEETPEEAEEAAEDAAEPAAE